MSGAPLVIAIAGLAVAIALGAWVRGRQADREFRPSYGPCRRCGRPVAVMHGELVHTTPAGIFVATGHRPLPVDVYGPHPAAGTELAEVFATNQGRRLKAVPK